MIGTVHCDTCGHDIDDVRVQDFHLKACEKCGASPLISDEDKVYADTMDSMQSVGWLKSMTKAEAAAFKENDTSILMTIDTSVLRK